eukprot:3304914-Pleurochrysis_carterae.AAC.3
MAGLSRSGSGESAADAAGRRSACGLRTHLPKCGLLGGGPIASSCTGHDELASVEYATSVPHV